jgi:hypothetical protein
MNVKSIKEFCEEKPFRPFTVHLADGRSIPVEHPEMVLYPPSGQEVMIYQPDNSFDFIDVFQITSLRQKRKPAGKSQKKSNE